MRKERKINLTLTSGLFTVISLCLLSYHFTGHGLNVNRGRGEDARLQQRHLAGQESVLQRTVPDVDPKKYSLSQLLGYRPRRYGVVPPQSYILQGVGHPDMMRQKQVVDQYLASTEFEDKLRTLKATGLPRGILVNAGGRGLLTHLVVLLKVLRDHHQCTLPVEIAWHGPQEMDWKTLENLNATFGPLYGFDVTQIPYPWQHRSGVNLQRWEGKVFSLLFTRFQEVMLLDSDVVPLRDPTYLFDSPQYQQYGNLFWPDFWGNWVKGQTWQTLGLNSSVAQAVLNDGKGGLKRDAETGQLLINRLRHSDVLEYIYWINSFSSVVYYKMVHGDKDTFPLGFAVAGRAHEYMQLGVAPGGAFHWSEKDLLTKATSEVGAGWRLLGALQYDNQARPVFFHRTMDKWDLDHDPLPIQLVSGPLPYRWAKYYLAHDSLGPTKGTGWQHVVPPTAVQLQSLSGTTPLFLPSTTSRSWEALHGDGCDLKLYLEYRYSERVALPVEVPQELSAACGKYEKLVQGQLAHLEVTLPPDGTRKFDSETQGTSVEAANQRLILPQGPSGLGNQDVLPGSLPAQGSSKVPRMRVVVSPEYLEARVVGENRKEVGDPTPIPMLQVSPPTRSDVLKALEASYDAYKWLRSHLGLFPILQQKV